MKETTSQRLKYIMRELNLKQVDVIEKSKAYQKELNVSLGKSALSQYVNGKSVPDQGKLTLLSKVLGVTQPWLMGYDVPMTEHKEQSSTKTILDNIFGKLEKPRQEIVINTAQEQLDEQNKENLVQLFSYNVQEKLSAGTGYGYFDDGNYDTVYYDEEYDYDYASWIFGDSMLPDYQNGDVALIKACPFEYDGCVYAVDWDGQSYIKKVYKEEKGLRLVSTNEKYSDKFAPYSEEPRIIGKVVGSFTPIQKSI